MVEPGQIDFDSWRTGFLRALETGGEAKVPCGSCTACCRSYQFVVIEPDEVATLARIDPRLVAPAPGRRDGARVLAYDSAGRCPMLGERGCRIYEDRPRTCRAYDCRVFAAAGVRPDQPLIASRVLDWVFGPSTARTTAQSAAASALEAGADPRQAAIRAITDPPG